MKQFSFEDFGMDLSFMEDISENEKKAKKTEKKTEKKTAKAKQGPSPLSKYAAVFGTDEKPVTVIYPPFNSFTITKTVKVEDVVKLLKEQGARCGEDIVMYLQDGYLFCAIKGAQVKLSDTVPDDAMCGFGQEVITLPEREDTTGADTEEDEEGGESADKGRKAEELLSLWKETHTGYGDAWKELRKAGEIYYPFTEKPDDIKTGSYKMVDLVTGEETEVVVADGSCEGVTAAIKGTMPDGCREAFEKVKNIVVLYAVDEDRLKVHFAERSPKIDFTASSASAGTKAATEKLVKLPLEVRYTFGMAPDTITEEDCGGKDEVPLSEIKDMGTKKHTALKSVKTDFSYVEGIPDRDGSLKNIVSVTIYMQSKGCGKEA